MCKPGRQKRPPGLNYLRSCTQGSIFCQGEVKKSLELQLGLTQLLSNKRSLVHMRPECDPESATPGYFDGNQSVSDGSAVIIAASSPFKYVIDRSFRSAGVMAA